MGTEAEQRITALDRVLELGALIERDQRQTLPRIGLTASRAHALWLLGATGPTTHGELALALGVVPRSVTDLVDALQTQGLVTRERKPGDRRVSVVTLTTSGQEMVERLRRQQRHFADSLFADLSVAEIVTFTESMDRILATLRPLVQVDSS